jgi:hypothetical protein
MVEDAACIYVSSIEHESDDIISVLELERARERIPESSRGHAREIREPGHELPKSLLLPLTTMTRAQRPN